MRFQLSMLLCAAVFTINVIAIEVRDASAEVALTPAQKDFVNRFISAVQKKDAKALNDLWEPASPQCQSVDQIHYRQKIIAKYQQMEIPEKRTTRLLPFNRPKPSQPDKKNEDKYVFQTEPTHLIILSYVDPRPTPGPSVTLDCKLKPSPTEQEACMARARLQLPGGPKNEPLPIRETGGKWFLALPCPKTETAKPKKSSAAAVKTPASKQEASSKSSAKPAKK